MALSHPEVGSSSLAVLNCDNIHAFRGLVLLASFGFHVLNPGEGKPKSLGVVLNTRVALALQQEP